MPVRIRLKRMGMKGRPFYRIIVANSASPRDGKHIDHLGHYDPMTDPSTIKVDEAKALLWLGRGAQPTESAAMLLKRVGVLEKFEAGKKKPAEAAG